MSIVTSSSPYFAWKCGEGVIAPVHRDNDAEKPADDRHVLGIPTRGPSTQRPASVNLCPKTPPLKLSHAPTPRSISGRVNSRLSGPRRGQGGTSMICRSRLAGLGLVAGLVGRFLRLAGNAVPLAQPAAQVQQSATLAAKGHRRALLGIEPLAACGTTNFGHLNSLLSRLVPRLCQPCDRPRDSFRGTADTAVAR